MSKLTVFHVLLSFLGIAAALDLATLGGTSLGGVTSALAVTIAFMSSTLILLAVVAVTHAGPGGASPPHPRRAIDASAPLAQSDPDAPGHPRPRAPQLAASAA